MSTAYAVRESGGAEPPRVGGIEAPERVAWRRGDSVETLLSKEWLVTNGLGGYTSGTVAGTPTRRYHGVLVSSLRAPLGRTLMLNHFVESVRLATGEVISLNGLDHAPDTETPLPVPLYPDALAEFRLHNGRPRWRFEQSGVVLEKTVLMPHRQNTTHLVYRIVSAPGPVTLVLEPLLAIRPHDGSVATEIGNYEIKKTREGFSIDPANQKLPPLHLLVRGGAITLSPHRQEVELRYRIEQARGYDWCGSVLSLGKLQIAAEAGAELRIIASTESWDQVAAIPDADAQALDEERRLRLIAQARPELRRGIGAELVLAADQFVIKPHTRPGDEAVLTAQGDDACTIIAGYHWFTDWGRDTMISLEGLTLLTGRFAEARDILHTFAHHIRDGLIPNMFPEGKNEGLYHTADATLWFFHAIDRYETITGDHETRRFLLPQLVDIAEKHFAGTRFGIGVDPEDGLLRQGAPGYQLTWMDAKVGDWVVTPRRGKAVEINALFFNALELLQAWLREAESDGWAREKAISLTADEVAGRAAVLRASFNRRFWYAGGGYLYDVVDGEPGRDGQRDDASLRPNQLLAISLPHPVLDRTRWEAVLRITSEQLLTPFGLRSLAPGHPDYKSRYDGDLRARDAAYHQGTVWGWLMGPFIDAWVKTHPDDPAGAHRLFDGLDAQLEYACIGTISEICDADPPFSPRGCVAQAWSIAEALRIYALINARGAGRGSST